MFLGSRWAIVAVDGKLAHSEQLEPLAQRASMVHESKLLLYILSDLVTPHIHSLKQIQKLHVSFRLRVSVKLLTPERSKWPDLTDMYDV